MYIEKVPNRASPPAVLLRESYREDGKVKKRTLANLSKLPAEVVERIRQVVNESSSSSAARSEPSRDGSFEILRSLPHGHVAAALGVLKQTGLASVLASRRSRQRDLVCAMIVQRIIDPASKLALVQGLREESAQHSLHRALGIEHANENDLYRAMDWLVERQDKIEAKLAQRHLEEGCLVLYDLTSTYFEGRSCPLAKLGYSRDGKKGKLQIVFGLLCNTEGCPVSVEVFEGNTSDPSTLSNQIAKLRERFGLRRVVWVGDRGMITDARIREEFRGADLDWISALRAPAIKSLVAKGLVDRSLFDTDDLAEITSPDYPGERLVVCMNPLLAAERTRKRDELVEATRRDLDKIVKAVERKSRPLRGSDNIGVRVGKVLNRFKMGKHFILTIEDTAFSYQLDEEKIKAEAALDGIYVVRTNVAAEELSSDQVVACYKGLSKAERAFRCMKTVDLKVRPIHHHLEKRVRAHVFLCMLAYYVEWHMRAKLAPFLFDDEDHSAGERRRKSVVQKAQLSVAAEKKKHAKRNADGDPVQAFGGLLSTLATLCLNVVQVDGDATFDKLTTPTTLQQKIFASLGVPYTLQPL